MLWEVEDFADLGTIVSNTSLVFPPKGEDSAPKRNDTGNVTIPQYRYNKTKQHTSYKISRNELSVFVDVCFVYSTHTHTHTHKYTHTYTHTHIHTHTNTPSKINGNELSVFVDVYFVYLNTCFRVCICLIIRVYASYECTHTMCISKGECESGVKSSQSVTYWVQRASRGPVTHTHTLIHSNTQ